MKPKLGILKDWPEPGSREAEGLLADARRRDEALSTPIPLRDGSGRFTLTHRIGSGNMGQVFRATDAQGRVWALKKAVDDNARRRQQEEVERAGQLEHPNVLRVHGPIIHGPEAQYLRMELIEGCTLAEWLEAYERPRLDAGLQWCADAASGLAHAHARGVVHRDLKPSNAMIGPDLRLRLIDFGLAKADTSRDLTQTGAALGTLKYQAPEVFAESHVHDAVTDVFALGLVMAEILTGAHVLSPAIWELAPTERYAGARSAYAALDWRAPTDVPGEVVDVIRRCLAVARSARPTAEEVRAVIAGEVERREVERRQAAEARRRERAQREAEARAARARAAAQSEVGEVGPARAAAPAEAPARPARWPWALAVAVGMGGAWLARGWLDRPAEPIVSAPVLVPVPWPVQSPEGMVHVPAGKFWRGCAPKDEECDPDETASPWRAEVDVPGFFIDRTEVTVADYAACVAAKKCSDDKVDTSDDGGDWSQWCTWRRSGRGKQVGLSDHPMNCVSFEQARAYCASKGQRLPTEQEWEKAARGTSGAKYGWSGDAAFGAGGRRRANVCDANCLKKWTEWKGLADYDDGYQVTAPVASYGLGASPYGAYDMIGNVWEWVEWVDGLALDPEKRALRGGSWRPPSEDARASDRSVSGATYRFVSVGFRCALSE